ncbi:hypothetical protein [Acinetobacter sp. ANC 5378]|uniref:hypothetical protein n=1 Tax=Acinetobacter sp. ANC 5378 TaxID=2731249 RepID=UPI00148F9B6E|nr:hypothetical protein [Acinetobacter sp. ANC 5378]NNG81010.1 hypothetical protein [Acinetobacter sp. ANC 5378]
MASQLQDRVARAKQANYKDSEIWNELRKNSDFNNRVKQARAAGFTQDQIAQQLGLKVKFIDSKPKPKPQPAPKPEKPSLLVDIGAGMDDIFSGIKQGALWAGDRAAKQSNINLGTNFDTNDYGKFTKAKAEEKAFYEKTRKESGAGMNVGRFIGQTVATLPVSAAAKGFGTAKVLSGPGAKVLAQNALVGGAIGGAGFAENAGQRGLNVAAGAAGGAVGAVAGDKVGKGIAKVAQKTVPSVKAAAQTRVSQTIDDQIEAALKQRNINIGDLSDNIVNGLRKDVAAALKSGKAVNQEAVARKVVFDRVGIRPTKAQLTGDPKLWQKQAELAKIQGAGDPLREKLIQDNQVLTGLLDDVTTNTGGKADDAYGAAQNAVTSLKAQNTQNKQFINAAYDNARKTPGNDAVLDGRGFANDAITKLDEQYAMSSLPPSVSKIIKDIEKTPDSFTLGKSEELVKILNREYKASLQNGQPTSATYAIGVVRDALEGRQSEAMRNLAATGGNDAATAYQFARNANKFNAQQIESIPLLKDAIKGTEPDKLFQKHVLNSNVAELKKTVDLLNNVDPQSVADIKGQVLKHISNQSINQNGQFSPAGMKRVLDSIGDRRLNTLFSPEEVLKIKDIGMAGHYLVTQPAHSYVNNSNTSAALMNFFLGVVDLPGVKYVAGPFKRAANAVKVNNALKPSITSGTKVPEATLNNMRYGNGEKAVIEQLTKLGVIGGANQVSR